MHRLAPVALCALLLVSGCSPATALESDRGAGEAASGAASAAGSEPASRRAADDGREQGSDVPALGRGAGALLGSAAERVRPELDERARGLLEHVPGLRWTSADHIAAAWDAVRELDDPVRQYERIEREDLRRRVCPDLVDLRAWEGRGLPPFHWRDRVRGRSWATPTMAAMLIRAWERLQRSHPEAAIAIGDVSQPGCGALRHATLVDWVRDAPAGRAEASRLLNRARLRRGRPTRVEEHRAFRYLLEWRRFARNPFEPIRVERRVLGRADVEDTLRLRVATRRYRRKPADEATRGEAFERLAGIVAEGRLVRARRVPTRGDDGELRHEWVQRWVRTSRDDQAVTVASHRLEGELDREALRRFRLGPWNGAEPVSMREHALWLAGDEPGAWRRWRALYEAGHATHTAGRDVDVAYVTRDNRRHFAIDLERIDVEATWAWYEAMDAAARELGTSLDRILVDPRVEDLFERALPPEALDTELWQERVRLAWGHRAHHHVRLETPSAEARRRARTTLEGLGRPARRASLRVPEAIRGDEPRAGTVPAPFGSGRAAGQRGAERSAQSSASRSSAAPSPEEAAASTPTPSR